MYGAGNSACTIADDRDCSAGLLPLSPAKKTQKNKPAGNREIAAGKPLGLNNLLKIIISLKAEKSKENQVFSDLINILKLGQGIYEKKTTKI